MGSELKFANSVSFMCLEMIHNLPNTSAETLGFIIPRRFSSLQNESKRAPKDRRRSSLDRSRDDVAERMRILFAGSGNTDITNKPSFSSFHVGQRQFFIRPTSYSTSTSTSSSTSPPVSLYNHRSKPLPHRIDDLFWQTRLKIKTFRTSAVPDPSRSPDIGAHPANSAPESPIDYFLLPTNQSVHGHATDTKPAAQTNNSHEPPVNMTWPLSLPPSLSADKTDVADVTVSQPSTAADKRIRPRVETTIQQEATCAIHHHPSDHVTKLNQENVYTPTQYFATGLKGKLIKIPVALGESLQISKERELKMGGVCMGWD